MDCLLLDSALSGVLQSGQRLAKPGLSGFNSNSSEQMAQTLMGKGMAFIITRVEVGWVGRRVDSGRGNARMAGVPCRIAGWRAASALLAGAALLLSSSELLAQRHYRDLQGTVRDRHQEPLKGAVVQVENQNTHSVLSYVTDQSGRYSFMRLQSDTDYSVCATYRGRRSKTKTLSLFDVRLAKKIDLVVKLR